METRFLQTLLTVIETGSAAETARRMNITASAVNQRIKALEAEIGQQLLRRVGQRMQPTAPAHALVASARQMLALEEDMKAVASADTGTGRLRIGVIQTVLTGLMPDILLKLRRNQPGIDLYLVPGTSGDLYTRLTQGELDLAILVKPHFLLPKSLNWTTLRREQHLFISPPGLGEVDATVMLRKEPFIRYDRNHWGGRIVDQYLHAQRIRPCEQHELDSLEAIVIMVSRGLGVSIIPNWPAPWPQGARINQMELTDAPLREVGVIWSRSAIRLPLIRNFIREAKS
ncbi:LysR substrate-binding domain-containing protein [Hoeflea sp. G2-23]|uniref:LysR substrate-binding domain-containing protein n=1 Tax=Hoeflea algicola TaxID=2983763 RepID=A0ABT3ZBV8_9HYPH|nr:LysR substrate-binding domain-containing protein [Hoeflea algicola]MCY0149272.1 LysR substrate-binding domain-containing protein [Hoeflea algicola]